MMWDIMKFAGRLAIGSVLFCVAWQMLYASLGVAESFFSIDLSVARHLMEPVSAMIASVIAWLEQAAGDVESFLEGYRLPLAV